MITLNTFRANLYPLFRLSAKTTVGFEVVHHGVAYDVTIVPTKKKPNVKRAPRKPKVGLGSGLVSLDNCPACGELAIAGVCLNKTCTNSRLS